MVDDAPPESLVTIWQAQGVIMAVRGCSVAQATELLARGAADERGLLAAARAILALHDPHHD